MVPPPAPQLSMLDTCAVLSAAGGGTKKRPLLFGATSFARSNIELGGAGVDISCRLFLHGWAFIFPGPEWTLVVASHSLK